MSETPAPTVRLIAEASGVHFTTVAKILRGKSRASLATRTRVMQVAKRLGYRPNPLASAWMAQRRAANPSRTEVNLGFIFPFAEGIRENLFEQQIGKILHARAHLHGYSADDFGLDDYASLDSLARVVDRRGIKGIVWVGVVNRSPLPEVFSGCAMCSLGGEMVGVPTVRTRAFEGMRIALKRLAEMGKRRPALLLLHRPTDVNLIRYEAAFQIAYQKRDFAGSAPVVRLNPNSRGNWMSKLKAIPNADVLLTNGFSTLTDLPTAFLDARPGEGMGLDQRHDDMATIAVDQVGAALLMPAHQSERPHSDLGVWPRWVDALA